jgi:hypothetical protein
VFIGKTPKVRFLPRSYQDTKADAAVKHRFRTVADVRVGMFWKSMDTQSRETVREFEVCVGLEVPLLSGRRSAVLYRSRVGPANGKSTAEPKRLSGGTSVRSSQ